MPATIKLLVVDDEALIRDMLRMAFAAPSFELRCAPDEASALAVLATYCPDIVLLDVQLPGGSGLDFCARLRGHTDLRIAGARIILMSGALDERQRAAAVAAGVQACVRKPFNIAELRGLVRSLAGAGPA